MQTEREPPSIGALFVGFLGLGLIGFGGVLPLARRMLVERKRWLTPDAFTELLGLCQFLPGGNIINLSVAVGLEFRGVGGAAASPRRRRWSSRWACSTTGSRMYRRCSMCSPGWQRPRRACWWPPR
jgi:hypothetical protein